MFSPYYARARRRASVLGGIPGVVQGADPLNHCAVNVALYTLGGSGGARWTMTERGRQQVQRSALTLQIGPSALRWAGDALQIELDEIAVPWPSRIRGTVTLHPTRRFDHSVVLAPGHRWRPIAPAARVEVKLGDRCWSGPGYLDSNQGDAPLERAFRRWDWSRAHLANGDSVVLYDVDRLGAEPAQIGLRFDARSGRVETLGTPETPPASWMPATRWGISRSGRSDAGTPPRVRQTLTDAPFYARSVLDAHWLGEPVTVMHESLSLARFDTAWVQAMLPFRMPRKTR